MNHVFKKWTIIFWSLTAVYLVVGTAMLFISGGIELSIKNVLAMTGYGIISIGFYGGILYVLLSIPIWVFIKMNQKVQ